MKERKLSYLLIASALCWPLFVQADPQNNQWGSWGDPQHQDDMLDDLEVTLSDVLLTETGAPNIDADLSMGTQLAGTPDRGLDTDASIPDFAKDGAIISEPGVDAGEQIFSEDSEEMQLSELPEGFPTIETRSEEELRAQWERIKQEEKLQKE